uniref:Uncharacterized protein n=1 Tax=Anopheles atroparvus TaxID=41427 RepID=A0AAG5DHY6_ANOAO
MANTLCTICFCNLAIILLLPASSGQWTSHQQSEDRNSQTPGGSGGSGFGYELLRNQLDEMQGGISQLQQNAGRCGEYEAGIATLQTGITALLRRLEGIEKTLKGNQRV